MKVFLAAAVAALVVVPSAFGLTHFRSPSGNINCLVTTTFADCLVKQNSWRTLPRRPASCDVDFFPAEVILSGNRVGVGSCRGDVGPLCVPTTADRCSVLGYGRSVTVGRIRCSSATNGVTCRRTDNGKGFRIAREGYVLYR